MAKRKVGRRRAAAARPIVTRGRIVLVLVGFVLLAIGVNLRRVYGFNQARQIVELEQKREALVADQLRLQEAIRIASDRQHVIEIAESRLHMKLPDLNQVIFLPRRALASDSLKP
jgi:cell division protein FtsL